MRYESLAEFPAEQTEARAPDDVEATTRVRVPLDARLDGTAPARGDRFDERAPQTRFDDGACTWVRLAPRLVSFLFFGLGHVLGYLAESIIVAALDRDRLQGEWFRRFLVRMGPLYIKLGQILATRSDLLPEHVVVELRALQDDVPPMTRRDLEDVLRRAYGDRLFSVFETFTIQPLASASIAQVHAAWLKNGHKVAVKVVKKNVRNDLHHNFLVLYGLLRLFHWCRPSVRHLKLPERLLEVRGMLTSQADMRQELQNQQAISTAFEHHPYVRIPAVLREFSTEDVLVMEFVDAIPCKEVNASRLDKVQMAQRVQEAIYTMLYLHGRCQADPHPGNLFFSTEGHVIFVDFGIVAFLSEDEKWALSSFFYACTRGEWRVAVGRFIEHFLVDLGEIPRQPMRFRDELEAVLRSHFEQVSTEWSTLGFFSDCSAVLRRYAARYTTNFTKIELVFISCEGCVRQFGVNVNIWENARKFNDRFSPYMSPAIKKAFDDYFGRAMSVSMRFRQRAHAVLVAPTHLDRYFLPSEYPLFIRNACGSVIEDLDGNQYIDLSCGYGPHILGYAHPVIQAAVRDALASGSVNALGNVHEVELATRILEGLPAAQRVLLCNSGTEAVMIAIRLCRTYRKRLRVAKFEGHYHGFSDQGLVSSWFRFSGPESEPRPVEACRGCSPRTLDDTLVLQYGDREALRRLHEHADTLACVIVEPLPAPMATYDAAFLADLRRTCTALQIPLVFDEVVSGFRVAFGGVQTLTGVEPDLTCLGKIIGGGLPCGAVAGRRSFIEMAKTTQDPFRDYEERAFAGGTLSGNSASCAAGAATLGYLRAHLEIYDRLEGLTNALASRLSGVASRHGVPFHITGTRSIFSISFSFKPARFHRHKSGGNFKANLGLAYYMRKYGVYMPELHTMLLSAAHSHDDIVKVSSAFDASLADMIRDGFFVL